MKANFLPITLRQVKFITNLQVQKSWIFDFRAKKRLLNCLVKLTTEKSNQLNEQKQAKNETDD